MLGRYQNADYICGKGGNNSRNTRRSLLGSQHFLLLFLDLDPDYVGKFKFVKIHLIVHSGSVLF